MKAIAALCATLIAMTAFAQSGAPKRDEIRALVAEIRILHKTGAAIRRNQSDEELRACVKTANPLREKATTLRTRAMKLDEYRYQMALVYASDDAFSCLYCAGQGKTCSAVAKQLVQVEAWLSEEQR